MKLETLTKKYLDLVSKLDHFEKNNGVIVSAYKAMTDMKKSLEDQLKDEVKEVKTGFENKKIVIKYIPIYSRSYNFNKFLEQATDKEFQLLKDNDGVEIKKDIFEQLVKDGEIDEAVVTHAFSESLKSTRVDIKIKQEKE